LFTRFRVPPSELVKEFRLVSEPRFRAAPGARSRSHPSTLAAPPFLHCDSAALQLKLNEVVRIEPSARDQ
jgi:hypothetical protein